MLDCNTTVDGIDKLPKDGNISMNVLVYSDQTEYVSIGHSFGVDMFGKD